jgi:hypothetical protein
MTESTYQIQVQGQIGERWLHWFDDMRVTLDHSSDGVPITTLTGPVADQAALRGILAKIWDLNLTLLSVTRCKLRGAGSNE